MQSRVCAWHLLRSKCYATRPQRLPPAILSQSRIPRSVQQSTGRNHEQSIGLWVRWTFMSLRCEAGNVKSYTSQGRLALAKRLPFDLSGGNNCLQTFRLQFSPTLDIPTLVFKFHGKSFCDEIITNSHFKKGYLTTLNKAFRAVDDESRKFYERKLDDLYPLPKEQACVSLLKQTKNSVSWWRLILVLLHCACILLGLVRDANLEAVLYCKDGSHGSPAFVTD